MRNHPLEELNVRLDPILLLDMKRLGEYYLWTGLDSVLTRPTFSNLRAVRIFLFARHTNSLDNTRRLLPDVAQLMRSRMVLLHATGVLDISLEFPDLEE